MLLYLPPELSYIPELSNCLRHVCAVGNEHAGFASCRLVLGLSYGAGYTAQPRTVREGKCITTHICSRVMSALRLRFSHQVVPPFLQSVVKNMRVSACLRRGKEQELDCLPLVVSVTNSLRQVLPSDLLAQILAFVLLLLLLPLLLHASLITRSLHVCKTYRYYECKILPYEILRVLQVLYSTTATTVVVVPGS